MRPEERLVLAACRRACGAPIDLGPLLGSADPSAATALALRIGVRAVVARELSALDPGWRPAWHESVARSLFLADRARWVVRLLGDRGIGASILKGLPLAQWAFGSMTARDSSDVDVLVRREQFSQAAAALAAAGLHPFSALALRGVVEAGRPGAVGALAFTDGPATEAAWVIDLHSAVPLPPPFRGDIAELLLANAADESDLPSPGPVGLTLHAVVHWVQHAFGIKTLVDVAATHRRDPEAWSAARRLAGGLGFARAVDAAEREAHAFVTGVPSRLPLGIGSPRALLRDPLVDTTIDALFRRSIAFGIDRATAGWALGRLTYGVRLDPFDDRSRRRRVSRLLTRGPRAFRALARLGANGIASAHERPSL